MRRMAVSACGGSEAGVVKTRYQRVWHECKKAECVGRVRMELSKPVTESVAYKIKKCTRADG